MKVRRAAFSGRTSMASGYLHPVLRHIRRLAIGHSGTALADAELLERFVSRRDEAAFSALLERHGPMVWGVCRRLLRDSHRAEDAFQATFLVLVRKAGAIGQRERLANWLYGVAVRVALRARVQVAQRQERERALPEVPAVTADTTPQFDLNAVLDEAVQRLPARYRLPVVLCYLQGKTNAEAAADLGWPEGTVFSRLARARERLRQQLGRRGIALSAGALAAAMQQQLPAVPPSTINDTLHLALLTLAGPAAAPAVVSPPVAALAEGVMRAMFFTQVKTIATAAALIVLLAGSGLLA